MIGRRRDAPRESRSRTKCAAALCRFIEASGKNPVWLSVRQVGDFAGLDIRERKLLGALLRSRNRPDFEVVARDRPLPGTNDRLYLVRLKKKGAR